jgi:hypothetical protein
MIPSDTQMSSLWPLPVTNLTAPNPVSRVFSILPVLLFFPRSIFHSAVAPKPGLWYTTNLSQRLNLPVTVEETAEMAGFFRTPAINSLIARHDAEQTGHGVGSGHQKTT